MNNAASVYILKNENSRVKIGYSNNPKNRMASIQSLGGYEIVEHYFSDECTNYVEIENLMHNEFSAYRKIGEWFNVPFDMAVDYLKTLVLKIDGIKKIEDSYGVLGKMITSYEDDCATLEKIGGESRESLNKSLKLLSNHYSLSDLAIDDFIESYAEDLKGSYPMWPGYHAYLMKKITIDCVLSTKIDCMINESTPKYQVPDVLIMTIRLLLTKKDDGDDLQKKR